MSLAPLLNHLRLNRDFMSQVVAWEKLPPRPGRYAPFPAELHPHLIQALQAQGLTQLYTHQQQATQASLAGQHVVVATSTASGKTLCYTLPVLHRLLNHPAGRALYLFPTKALAQDQLASTQALLTAGKLPLTSYTYDGDTPRSQRTKIRQNAQIIISNPDMLHAGILPYHTQWREFLRQLQYVVIDEIHAYRGVFGSHVANVLRRLQRLCAFYGSSPQFVACSATIANPLEHAQKLVEQPFTLIDDSQNGAPRGAKQFIVYNPPIIDETLGLRKSSVISAKDAAVSFILEGVQTAVFARARQTVELLLRYVQDELSYQGQKPEQVAGYRGGYLPLERRTIEKGLREGSLRGVVSTNALELGVDIGELEAAVLTGYPGSIASTWQQAGRAGRRAGESVAVLIASNTPLDQYLAQHPRYLFGRNPEQALLNPDNVRIMVKHLACSAFELPFRPGEPFGRFAETEGVLTAMQEMGLLHRTGGQFHWLGDGEQPAGKVSLRTSGNETVLIQERPGGRGVIAEVELESAPLMVHEQAIYLHQGEPYLVEELDWPGRVAYVRPTEMEYITRATITTDIKQLTPEQESLEGEIFRAYGDVLVVSQATGYRKIKLYTQETLGYGEIDLPAQELDTQGYWFVLSQALTEQLYDEGVLLRPNEYGPNWAAQRQQALARDQHKCRTCGAVGGLLHVHHIRPFREYGYIPGRNTNYLEANRLENLVTLCPSCHRRAEQSVQARSALGGLAYVLRNLAPLYLMCDPTDIQVTAEAENSLTKAPTILIYEQTPAGVGFAQRLFEVHQELLGAAVELITACFCRDGCPACVGPAGETGPDTKQVTLRLLQILQKQR